MPLSRWITPALRLSALVMAAGLVRLDVEWMELGSAAYNELCGPKGAPHLNGMRLREAAWLFIFLAVPILLTVTRGIVTGFMVMLAALDVSRFQHLPDAQIFHSCFSGGGDVESAVYHLWETEFGTALLAVAFNLVLLGDWTVRLLQWVRSTGQQTNA